jgi:hypothetical protein
MMKIGNVCGLFAALMIAFVSAAQAESKATAKKVPVTTVSLAKSGDCCVTPPACEVYKPCVTYCGGFCGCGPKVSQTLQVKDPCCCCSIAEIPVCLPECCKKPCVYSKCGLFGRGIVTYSYEGGCCVTIVFRRCGDVVVKYSG